jgi:hypothetical protein
MTCFTKLLFVASSGIDPFVFIEPICLGLGACLIAAMAELERIRARRNQARRSSPKPQAVPRRHPPDHHN